MTTKSSLYSDLSDLFQSHCPQIYIQSAEKMDQLTAESIDLIVTSPPYGQIKDYDVEGQIGFGEDFIDYFTRLNKVWQECFRVLAPQCRMVVNIGDQYLRSSQYGRYRILPIANQIINDCTALGFDFLGDIIWQKISTTNTTGGCSLMGSLFYPRNGLATYDYEHILIFKKYEGKDRSVPRPTKELSKICMDEWKQWFVGHWKFPGVKQKDHIAMFPEELPYRIIRMFSNIGDRVLDPFAGSGTTLQVATALNRKAIGFEVNNSFLPLIQQKINQPFHKRDYHSLISKITSLLDEHFEFDFKFMTQKSIICLKNLINNQKLVLDLILFNGKETESDQKQILKLKLLENNFKNFTSAQKTWDSISGFVFIYCVNEKLLDLPENIVNIFTGSTPSNCFLLNYKIFLSPKFTLNQLWNS